ncbi:hypothetical protein B0H16DRAFT_1550455 [Mycena metata]|uniref:Uncharacterized protein n=1 Tax=Mycena metata TaxID=1033252 RepID=A0AAD7IU35_9AGAR|nr:hypothetical protein B0H16DRAFT_1550455 [Mycena metata]
MTSGHGHPIVRGRPLAMLTESESTEASQSTSSAHADLGDDLDSNEEDLSDDSDADEEDEGVNGPDTSHSRSSPSPIPVLARPSSEFPLSFTLGRPLSARYPSIDLRLYTVDEAVMVFGPLSLPAPSSQPLQFSWETELGRPFVASFRAACPSLTVSSLSEHYTELRLYSGDEAAFLCGYPSREAYSSSLRDEVSTETSRQRKADLKHQEAPIRRRALAETSVRRRPSILQNRRETPLRASAVVEAVPAFEHSPVMHVDVSMGSPLLPLSTSPIFAPVIVAEAGASCEMDVDVEGVNISAILHTSTPLASSSRLSPSGGGGIPYDDLPSSLPMLFDSGAIGGSGVASPPMLAQSFSAQGDNGRSVERSQNRPTLSSPNTIRDVLPWAPAFVTSSTSPPLSSSSSYYPPWPVVSSQPLAGLSYVPGLPLDMRLPSERPIPALSSTAECSPASLLPGWDEVQDRVEYQFEYHERLFAPVSEGSDASTVSLLAQCVRYQLFAVIGRLSFARARLVDPRIHGLFSSAIDTCWSVVATLPSFARLAADFPFIALQSASIDAIPFRLQFSRLPPAAVERLTHDACAALYSAISIVRHSLRFIESCQQTALALSRALVYIDAVLLRFTCWNIRD